MGGPGDSSRASPCAARGISRCSQSISMARCGCSASGGPRTSGSPTPAGCGSRRPGGAVRGRRRQHLVERRRSATQVAAGRVFQALAGDQQHHPGWQWCDCCAHIVRAGDTRPRRMPAASLWVARSGTGSAVRELLRLLGARTQSMTRRLEPERVCSCPWPGRVPLPGGGDGGQARISRRTSAPRVPGIRRPLRCSPPQQVGARVVVRCHSAVTALTIGTSGGNLDDSAQLGEDHANNLIT